MIGAVFRKNIIGEGPIDWKVVAEERLDYEATQYRSGEEDRVEDSDEE
jgi:hypothetical protein